LKRIVLIFLVSILETYKRYNGNSKYVSSRYTRFERIVKVIDGNVVKTVKVNIIR
jgi:hypothetical protein